MSIFNAKEKLKKIPKRPGVYKYLNTAGDVIYVGKAKNLRNRVGSYFASSLDSSSKTAILVSQIRDIQIIETLSEFEALILEAELIKKYQPKYNILLKDDKSYLYIVIRNELVNLNGSQVKVPIVLTARKPDILATDTLFGPYPDGNTARSVLRTIRKFLPYRDCSPSKFSRFSRLERPCLYGHLNLCQAPCAGRVTLSEYKKEINKLKRFLSGDTTAFINSLEKTMYAYSKDHEYEKAASLRDKLESFRYIRQRYKNIQQYVDNPYLVEDLRQESLEQLCANIPYLKDLPERIECYDISNISGKDAVGSMVVALDGELAKGEYRRFKIKKKDSPDDFYMMNEVLDRRIRRGLTNDPKWALPELIVVDGGKGQITSALNAMNKHNIYIPLVGLAKKYETIVLYDPDSLNFAEVSLARDNEGLKLLQRLRDEAHRFAQSYHHKLRLSKIK